ncbi:ubiquinone biosynthesis monooxygenase COQ6 [Sphaceloma murrayae]|uniref:Ubiquinone biosynthesis monooxygenase COQ6 n=1 Tax=Sphaceloma murrayae TaxID=2082308 RepID=A0A2K1QVM6_9PEZI|nr:ubiquinone biosynthesis monooxygenase COQ6 [Sphaceloma murrayae]
MPLRIIIVGAGIAGLTTALALAPHGHEILILEKSAFAAELGAAFHFGPYGVRVLERLKVDIEAMRPVICRRWNQTDSATLRDLGVKFDLKAKQRELGISEDEIMVHRVDAHNVLKAQALSHKNVELRLGSGVKTVDADKGVVTLLNEETIQGDVVIGADGIHSRCLSAIDPEACQTKPMGINMYRWTVEASEARKSPLVSEFLDKAGFPDQHTTFVHVPTRHSLVTYTCRQGELINCATFQLASADAKQLPEGDYRSPGSVEEVLHIMDGWPESYRELAKLATDVKHWAVISRDVPRSYCKGRLVVIGDAAHPTQPTHAAGANLGVEDAGVLSIVLGPSLDASKVSSRLQLFHSLRYERTVIAKFSSEMFQVGWLASPQAAEALMQSKIAGAKIPGNIEEFLWPVDAMREAEIALTELSDA